MKPNCQATLGMIIDCLKLPPSRPTARAARVLEIKQINSNHPGECSQAWQGDQQNRNIMFPFSEGLAEWLVTS